ncbi:hypothetical protein JYU34_003629 [Plutella xylostella]|uniref:Acyl-coenzyme A oxidase n=1 Tax=Plutella xylostella TaxID=51655 RepID=A0ABQ7R0I5_PLUXY|nr:hypothetical protein JYU34_003629 [Plutella xylostella]
MVKDKTLVKVNEDLARERKKCNFKVEELTNFLDGGVQYTTSRRTLENDILSHKELFDSIPEEYLSHKEKYENAIRKTVLYYRLMQKYQNYKEGSTILDETRANYRNLVSFAVFKDYPPLMLHNGMFIPAIAGQGTPEQQKHWLKRAKNMEILGTYAQTELGHGTFIRGLETTAEYDPSTEEFVLHSPTLTSYKWWPGGLAHTVNYCVVMAQLYIRGRHHGMQPFLVQLRDEETHIPLPGVKLGEIGAKLGLSTVNNGFLAFEHHRIPRDRMLMKNAQVLKDGTFVAGPSSKLAYGTMIYVRVIIVNGMANLMAKAATIAVRYSAVRRQSQIKPSEPECQILDYVTQQHKLLICIATSLAFSTCARWLWDVYTGVMGQMESGNMDHLPELHALACSLKVVSTMDVSGLVERCRLACGGHGFMHSSNLPYTYGLATAACTYEGENTVLLLQTARSLVKAWQKGSKGKPLSPTEAYLMDKSPVPKWENTLDGIIAGFRRVSAGKVQDCVSKIDKLVKMGTSYEDAWNQTSVRLVAASEAHSRAVILATFRAEVSRAAAALSPPLARVLHQLVHLYTVYWALERVGDLLLYTSIAERDVQELQQQYEDLLQKIRPNTVGLVDAFDLRDEILNSTLGAYDGRVYERLMEEALKSPLNAEPVNQSFHKYLKPFMQGKL